MIIRRSNERGHAGHGWLDTFHTFSFNTYYDPEWMGFHNLRVLNDDRVAPGTGFPTHPHREMEIITYVLSGAIAHRDSMGNNSRLEAGEVQVMSAGTGITHSEYNPSDSDELHLLQIWIYPDTPGVEPRYDQRQFPSTEREGQLVTIAAPAGADAPEGALAIHADARILGAYLARGSQVEHNLEPGRAAWVHVARGSATVNGSPLAAGDAAGIEQGAIAIGTDESAEVLVFDLAAAG